MRAKLILPLAVTTALFLTSCSADSIETTPATSSAPESLPFAEVIASETEFGSFQDIADQSDAVFQGQLVEIVDDWQRIEQQEGDTGDEYVGLRFTVTNLISGKLETDEVIVGFLAYAFDNTTKERVNTISINGLNISDFETGSEYLLTVARDSRLKDNYGIGWTSTIQSVDEAGTLLPLSDENGYEELGIDSIKDLQALDIEEREKSNGQPSLNDPPQTLQR